MAATLATTLVAVAETAYVGLIGTTSLAGMALVFPMVMLTTMMSSGAMGGGVSSAVSRALGAGDELRARALALHATVIGGVAGLGFTAFFLALGPTVYRLLGGRDGALVEALAYSNVFFLGATGTWLSNTFISVIRGGGNMKVPSIGLLVIALFQVAIGGGLGLGFGPLPRLGITGVALGQLVAYTAGGVFFFWFLASGRARVRFGVRGIRLRWDMFADILKVGALACASPLQTVLTILILTRLVAHFGTEALAGYGIGARLEFLLIPITFAVGVACVPMVGMAIGAGDIGRARRVAWTGAGISAVVLGGVGLFIALMPDLWARIFTDDPAALASARSYLRGSGLGYGFLGAGLCLYFASQGAGKVLGPVLAGTTRLIVIALGGWALAANDAPQWMMFALVGGAMVVYGVTTAAAVRWVSWGPAVGRTADR